MTTTPSKCLSYRGPDAKHDFDQVSGWCVYGCGLRQDGRHTTTAGWLIDPGPEYDDQTLATIATMIRKRTACHEQPTLELHA
jgi:hypothetical protein